VAEGETSNRVFGSRAIEPLPVALYLKTLADAYEKLTIKQRLAAISTHRLWKQTRQYRKPMTYS
jgi:hypothetical protein